MKERPSISEAELSEQMDFNQVLAGYQRHQLAVTRWWRLIGGASLLTAVIAVTYFASQPNPAVPSNPVTGTAEVPPVVASVAPDSATQIIPANAAGSQPARVEKKEPAKSTKKTESKSLQLPPQIVVTPTPVYTPAVPQNGYEDLYSYFHRELRYPEAALADSVEGIVTVSFMINKAGGVEQLKIEQSLGPLFDEEALRLVRQMPPWHPAQLGNEPTLSKLTLPITFRIQQ